MSHRWKNISLHVIEPLGRKAALRMIRKSIHKHPPLTSFWK